MVRTIVIGVLLSAAAVAAHTRETTAVTWTGWFSDKQCARVKPDEAPRPNGTACVKKCLDRSLSLSAT